MLVESQYAGCVAGDEWWQTASGEYRACRALTIADHTEVTANAAEVSLLPRMHFRGFGGMQHSTVYHPDMSVGDIYQLAVARTFPPEILMSLRFRIAGKPRHPTDRVSGEGTEEENTAIVYVAA